MVEDGRPQGADTPPRFDAMREAQRYIAALQDEVDRLRAALASGGTAAPTDEQVADALREWHDLTANQRATWDRLRPRWSLAAFIAHHLRVALAARTPQPAPDEETNDAR